MTALDAHAGAAATAARYVGQSVARLDVSAAAALDGVWAVWTAADLNGEVGSLRGSLVLTAAGGPLDHLLADGDVGGGFGQKVFLGREEIAVMVCSRRLDRPVCWIEGRSENLTSSNHARRDRADICLGASADGRFVAATRYTNTCGRGAYRGPWQIESVARPQSASSRWRR